MIGYPPLKQIDKVHELTTKLEVMDTATAYTREPSMVANVVKKICIAWIEMEKKEA
jgi:hypothetical protein